MLCRERNVRILERLVLHEGRPVRFAANLRGSLAVYRLERG
jgi:hypothetical protein